jgi:phage-related protein
MAIESGRKTKSKQLDVVISKPVKKELADLPEKIRDQFLVNILMLSSGVEPDLKLSHLSAVGPGVIELKINGSPAYRLVYTTKFKGELVILAARAKTAEGTDRQLLETVTSRLKRQSSA